MRCKACNTELTDHEATLKDKETREHIDLCGVCLGESNRALYDDHDGFKWDIGLSEND